ncbi:MAG: hypothetical protein ACAI25_14460, partial [Planctomycetota bacterium]
DAGSPEAQVRAGDELLQKGDRDGAEKAFEGALALVANAVRELIQVSDAGRHQGWFNYAVNRVHRTTLRARVGRVRALPLSEDARAKLEALVGPHVPSLDPPK